MCVPIEDEEQGVPESVAKKCGFLGFATEELLKSKEIHFHQGKMQGFILNHDIWMENKVIDDFILGTFIGNMEKRIVVLVSYLKCRWVEVDNIGENRGMV